jgi:hypothetical protein
MNNCKLNTGQWEDKSILLGIILFCTKNTKLLKNKKIILEYNRFIRILKVMFRNLTFGKKDNVDNCFYINIKNNNNKDLVINNLNNIKEPRTDQMKLLPWYDYNNPIIMYYYDSNLDVDELDEFKIYVQKFTHKKRFKNYTPNNDIVCKYNCNNNINIWDCYYEHKILKKYCKKYGNNIKNIYNFISVQLMDKNFIDKNTNILNNTMITNSQLYNTLALFSARYNMLLNEYNIQKDNDKNKFKLQTEIDELKQKIKDCTDNNTNIQLLQQQINEKENEKKELLQQYNEMKTKIDSIKDIPTVGNDTNCEDILKQISERLQIVDNTLEELKDFM